MAFVVVELQKNADGSFGNIVKPFETQNEAESNYHAVLAAAAISAIPVHSAVLLSEEGFPLMHGCYKHEQ
jgi:hypothetical protein